MILSMKTSGFLNDRGGRNWLRFRNAAPHGEIIIADFDLLEIPTEVRELLRLHEDYVNQQVFSLLDVTQEKVKEFGPSVVWDGENGASGVHDVQLAGGKLSFRLDAR